MGSFRNATTRLVATHLGLVLLATGLILAGIYWRAGGVIDAEQRAENNLQLVEKLATLIRAMDREIATPDEVTLVSPRPSSP